MNPLEQHIDRAIQAQAEKKLRRRAPKIELQQGLRYRINGQPALSFCSNDFLGFGSESLPLSASPGGSGASRLVHGSHSQIRELEAEFAQHLGCDDAILMPSGYQANIAGLAQLPLPEASKLFSDAYNHASIIDGLRLRSAAKEILPHLSAPPAANNWWIVESRYSMDGDAPEASQLQEHLEKGGYLYLDEAHRFGLEDGGHGLMNSLGSCPQLVNNPLGKAFGLQGAMLAGRASNIAWVKQFARAYTYTTATGPALCLAIQARLKQLTGPTGDARRQSLRKNIQLASELFETPISGPILSINLRDNELALRASQALLTQGFHVQAIRPPTVPVGTARLRITFSALHRPEEIQALHRALTQTIQELKA